MVSIYLFLVLSTLVVYWQVRHFEFTLYDDPYYVYLNRMVTAGITLQGVAWAFSTAFYDFWHPIMWLSHMLDCELFGLNAGMHHLVNVFIHVANTLLLFGLLRQMTGIVWRSALIAALFALHPLHVESVAWVGERKDVLSTFFFLLSLCSYVRYVRVSEANLASARFYYRLTLGLFILGLMTKPMVLTLPLVLLILDFWPLNRIPGLSPARASSGLPVSGSGEKVPARFDWKLSLPAFRRLALEKVPFFALALVFCVTTYLGMKGGQNILSAEKVPWALRWSNIPVSYVRYLGKMIWPDDLVPMYEWPARWEFWEVAGATLFLILITGLALAAVRRVPYLLAGWFLYLTTLLPVIGIVPAGEHCLADRYMYIPSIGLLLAMVWAVADLSARWPYRRALLGFISAAGLATCAFLSWKQIGIWRNDTVLWSHAVAIAPNNLVAQYNLACTLQAAGNTNAAMEHYQQALRSKPDSPMVHVSIGLILLESGRLDEAMKHCQEAYRLAPNNPQVCMALGRTFSAQGKSDEALNYLLQVVQLNPGFAEAFYHLGVEYLKRGALDEAAVHLSHSIALDPAPSDPHLYLGVALGSRKETSAAIAQYREALRLNPKSATARNNLAWILAADHNEGFRNGTEAVQLAEEACELTGNKETIYLGTLSAAYAEAGRFEDAIAASRKACDLAASLGQTNLLEQNQRLLERFQRREPYHE